MYADNIVILAESPGDLQTSLNRLQDYYTLYDLKLNISKNKVVIFSRGRLRTPHLFYFGEETIEAVNESNEKNRALGNLCAHIG